MNGNQKFSVNILLAAANSLDLDQDRQSVGPDLDPNCFKLW